MRTSLVLGIAFALSAPVAAFADVYDIHVGGICSTNFSGGNGNGRLGSWSGETSIDAYVDQNNSMDTATTDLAQTLNAYCTGSNLCYLYVYSNGGAVTSRTFSIYGDAWNIGYIVASASNEGGSELGGTGWVGQVFGGCYLAGHIGVSDNRNGWNHDDTGGVVTGMIGGDGWLAPYAQSAILPGHDDGAVAEESSGGYASTGSYSSICYGGKWTNHQAWWSCEYGDLNHYDMKERGICDDGGATGCKN